MSWIDRLRNSLGQKQLEDQLDDELQFHIEMRTREFITSGMTPEEARYRARRLFGNQVLLKERTREMDTMGWIETVWQDLSYAARILRKSRGFTAVAVLSLALGIGANTAIFSMLDAVLLRLLPVRDPQQLVIFNRVGEDQQPDNSFSYLVYLDLRAHANAFAGIFASSSVALSLNAGMETERIDADLVTGDFFSTLGVPAHLGRVLNPEDDHRNRAAPACLLSYGFWKRRFGGDPAIVGKKIVLNGLPFTIAGVASSRFSGIRLESAPAIYAPLSIYERLFPNDRILDSPFTSWLQIVGRLKPYARLGRAQAELSVTYQQSKQANLPRLGANLPPDIRRGILSERLLLKPGYQGFSRFDARPLWLLMGIVGLVLLIACANLANLLLARALGRSKEMALRLAIGASRSRLIRQLMTEGLVLALLGGGIGLLLALPIAQWLLKFVSEGDSSRTLDVRPDLNILAFTLGVSFLTGLLFSLIPAIQATRPEVMPALKEETTGGVLRRARGLPQFRSMLVVVQLALSIVLLTVAGLLLETVRNLAHLDLGYTRQNLLLASLHPGESGYSKEKSVELCEQLLKKVRALPGVRAATVALVDVLGGGGRRQTVFVPGHNDESAADMNPDENVISPGYFDTMGIPMLLGRDFTAGDGQAAPKVAVVNESFARHYFGSASPIGKRFGWRGVTERKADIEIVGLVKDIKQRSLREASLRMVYVPMWQDPSDTMTLHVRTGIAPGALAAAIRRELRSIDRNLPLFQVRTIQQQINGALGEERLMAGLVATFGALATLLAVIGLYGVTLYGVNRRTKEIGIRMALGAQCSDVMWWVMREILALVLIGVLLGTVGTLAASRLIGSFLYGLEANDAPTIAMAALLLMTTTVFAAYLSARRASRVDPMVALRYE